MEKQISFDYIRGLIDGEGCFSFCSIPPRSADGKRKQKLPCFTLAMSKRDVDLIRAVRDKLKIRNTVYTYASRKRPDNYNRDGMAILIVRDFGQIKNIIVPLFYKKLFGFKAIQFERWIQEMGSNDDVPERFNLITKIYNNGFYEKNFRNFD